ncbi:MAG: hypothetical protein J7M08_06985 [Planctomycetes bacterium]|nr:hypothetical protein [Planctomycetota bacterium]
MQESNEYLDRRRRSRRLETMTLVAALLLPGVLFGVTACKSARPIASPTPPLVRPELEEVKQDLMATAASWKTLTARCNLAVRSSYIRTEGSTAQFRRGRLCIWKSPDGATPAMVSLRIPEKGPESVYLVGDGVNYRVSMPALHTAYSGQYGGPPPAGGAARILFMPDDLATAYDPRMLFLNKAQVLRQGTFGYCIDSLVMLAEPTRKLAVASTVILRPRDNSMSILREYNDDGSLRAEIRFGKAEAIATSEKLAVDVPTSIFFMYAEGGTSIMLTLYDVELNTELDLRLFDVGG